MTFFCKTNSMYHAIFFAGVMAKEPCEIDVNSGVFGDPCPNTHKYVEVHYACSPHGSLLGSTVDASTRKLPPWLLETGTHLWKHRSQCWTSRSKHWHSNPSGPQMRMKRMKKTIENHQPWYQHRSMIKPYLIRNQGEGSPSWWQLMPLRRRPGEFPSLLPNQYQQPQQKRHQPLVQPLGHPRPVMGIEDGPIFFQFCWCQFWLV